MLAKLPNLTDTSISRLVQKSTSRPKHSQHIPRALSSSHLTNQHASYPYRYGHSASYYKPTGIQLRENQLQWMFNRRKQKLLQTSVQNFRLYNRIKAQKSQLAKFNKNKGKLLGSRVKTQGFQCLTQLNKELNTNSHSNYNSNINTAHINIHLYEDALHNDNQPYHLKTDENKQNIQINLMKKLQKQQIIELTNNYIKKKQENIKKLIQRKTQKQWRRYHSTHARNN